MAIDSRTIGAGLTPACLSALLWDLAKLVDKQNKIVRKPNPPVVDRIFAEKAATPPRA